MFTTTLAVIALAGGNSSGVIPSTPNWHTDYAQALSRSSAEGKPMAVFIGNGADKFAKMFADGTITADAARVLGDSYVCVYLDADTAAGKDLAGRFELTEGLVISSRGGSHQAYRHAGALRAAELAESLNKYAAGPTQPATTVTSGVVVWQQSGVVTGGYNARTAAAPATYYAPAAPQYVYPSSGYSYPQFNAFPAQNCTGFR